MTMTLEEVNDHIAQIRGALLTKNHQLPGLLLRDPAQAMQIKYQIECLEPRLDELERQAYRLAKEREAIASLAA
jgi:hypothetical protein